MRITIAIMYAHCTCYAVLIAKGYQDEYLAYNLCNVTIEPINSLLHVQEVVTHFM